MASPLLDFRSLQVLTTVCDKGNMTEAARSLGVTQSALSQARLNLTRAQYELALSDVALARASGSAGVEGSPPL